MKKQVHLALLGILLVAGQSVRADDTPKSKKEALVEFFSKTKTNCKHYLNKPMVKGTLAVAALVGVGYGIWRVYQNMTTEQAPKELV